jgi:hypothetical protein
MRHWVTDVGHADQTRLPRFMILAMLACVGLMAMFHLGWIFTGRDAWMIGFRVVSSGFLVATAALSAGLARGARRFFMQADPLRLAWSLLLVAAVVRLTGHVIAHVLPLAPLADRFSFDPDTLRQLSHAGLIVSGPVHMALVAVALATVVRLCARLGLLVRPSRVDILLAGVIGLFAVQFLRDLMIWRSDASAPAGMLDAIGWASDPLLALLLIEAMIIRRAAVAMGAGYVTRCWGAFAAAIFLTSVGDVGFWAEARGYVSWPWRSVFWYVWPIAEAAWALGPAWQLVACRAAQQIELPTIPTVSSTRWPSASVLPFGSSRA